MASIEQTIGMGENSHFGDFPSSINLAWTLTYHGVWFCGILPDGKMRPLALPLIFLLATPLLASENYTGKCVGVTDGDTISVMHAGKAVEIRLEGIDCPELGQDFGTRAKQFTSALVFGKEVQIKQYYPDRYGRMVARVSTGSQDVSLELVKAGLAWHFKRYSSDPVLAEAEVTARRAKMGLWSMPGAEPPWEWRKGRGRHWKYVDRRKNAGGSE